MALATLPIVGKYFEEKKAETQELTFNLHYQTDNTYTPEVRTCTWYNGNSQVSISYNNDLVIENV